MKRTLGLLGAVIFWAVAVPAYAEETGAKSSAPAEAKDVVRLKSGGLVRGTINELVPGDSVTIVTTTGKTREFPMADVAYAGSAARDPETKADSGATTESVTLSSDATKTEPAVTVTGQRAEVRLTSEPAGITFHRQSAAAVAMSSHGVAVAVGFEKLCSAPCQVTLAAGNETFALSRNGEFPTTAAPLTIPPGASTLSGHFESRPGLHIAGWVVAAGSLIGGSVLMYTSFEKKQVCTSGPSSCYDSHELHLLPFISGIGILGLGLPIGLGMAFARDVARIDLTPTQQGALPRAPGVLVTGKF